ncbi:MAG: UDP-N-acetylmuramoyl-L-alanine--D-glutamate ligase [Ruminococcaceae bacterium]|nr:UDP-N-acetylmuramoyl-L-alanine--D-glutamate ligase [Oscillospiraceae bacterium]
MFENFNDFLDKMKGKTVNVVGLGISNKPLIEILLKAGARVIGRDGNPNATVPYDIELVLGEGYLDNLEGDYTFKSPGIRPDKEQFLEFIGKGGILLSEMEVFFDVCPCKIIGITGSDGKTTTTTLISELLKASGYKVHIGGNIGTPLLPVTKSIKKDDICVVELSSFQLMTMKKAPDISVITNITPNHLDYHLSYEEYIEAKLNIAKNKAEGSFTVLNLDDKTTGEYLESIDGDKRFFSLNGNEKADVFYKDGYIYCGKEAVLNIEDIRIPGMHNVANYMTAYLAVKELTDKDALLKVAKEFNGVPYRIEFFAEKDGVKYYDDSIASGPVRTMSCLDTFARQGEKIILVAGGADKKFDFAELGRQIAKKAKALYLVGHIPTGKELKPVENTAEKIKNAVLCAAPDFPVYVFYTMEETVKAVKEYAKPGDVVVLSPASTSFDKYKNFEVRGNHFKECVKNG